MAYTVSNFLGHDSRSATVTIYTPIMGYESMHNSIIVLVQNVPLVITNNITNGTAVLAEVTLDDVPVRNMTWDGRQLTIRMDLEEHGVGPHFFNVTLTNPVSQVVNTFTVGPLLEIKHF